MVNDREAGNGSSTTKSQEETYQNESHKPIFINVTSDSSTCVSNSSSFSCSMGVSSTLTPAAATSPVPNQDYSQEYISTSIESAPENVLHQAIYQDKYSDIGGAFSITATGNSHPSNERPTHHVKGEYITSKLEMEGNKTVQKKRGRGRPPKLKPSKQEKEINELMEEESSISSMNSINSSEKYPLGHDFEASTVSEYNCKMPNHSQLESQLCTSSTSSASNNTSSNSNALESVIESSTANPILKLQGENLKDSYVESSNQQSYTIQNNQSVSSNSPISSETAEKNITTKNRSSNRLRGRPKTNKTEDLAQTSVNSQIQQLTLNGKVSTKTNFTGTFRNNSLQNGHTEDQLGQFTASQLVNGLSTSPKTISPAEFSSNLNFEENLSSQGSKEVSDSSRDSSVRGENDVDASIPMKVKLRWNNASQNDVIDDNDMTNNSKNDDVTVHSTSLLRSEHQNNCDSTFQNLNSADQLMQKRESRTRGDRRTSSKRTSPTQKDLSDSTDTKHQTLNMDCSSTTTSEAVKHYSLLKEMVTPAQRLEVQQRLKSFEHISTNVFICQRRRNKQTREMECDCSLSKEDIAAGKKGCGDDCLNRLLMVECNKSCSLGSNCANKRFQNVENSKTEVFKTEYKGVGLRAAQHISRDSFIMEYVGDVLDPQRFHKRAKKCSQDDVKHFYFMALSTQYIIDATAKGNISRFINHSCDPNSETQKWTVDGELRVGFFSRRKIKPGEEITFDYKYERYGQQAQKCYCGSSNCRGWLGGEPEKEHQQSSEDEETIEQEEECFTSSSEEPEELDNRLAGDKSPVCETSSPAEDPGFSPRISPTKEKRLVKRKLRRAPRKIKNFETDEFEEEIERLKMTGIRTKGHTVELCRLMVRVTDTKTRLILCHLLLDADSPCRRLFLDYHGLKILNSWMSDLTWKSTLDLNVKMALFDVLNILNIPHKTMLVESNVWQTISSWANFQVSSEMFDSPLPSKGNEVSNSEKPHVSSSPVPSNEFKAHRIPQVLKTDSKEPLLCDTDHDLSLSLHNTLYDKDENLKSFKNMNDESMIGRDYAKKESDLANSLPSQEMAKSQTENHGKVAETTQTDVLPVQKTEQKEHNLFNHPLGPNVKQEYKVEKEENSKNDGGQVSTKDEELYGMILLVKEKAVSLLSIWETLKEVFKIPRKELVKIRAEHEKELEDAEQYSKKNKIQSSEDIKLSGFGSFNQQRFGLGSSVNGKIGYERNRPAFRPHSPPPKNRETHCSKFDDKTGRLNCAGISRDHRRYYISQKFEMEKEEKRKRDLLQAWHENKCYYLRLDPAITPMFPEIPEFYFDPTVGTWYQMPELPPQVDVWGKLGFPHMARLPKEAFRETDSPLPDPTLIYPPGVVKVSYLYGQPMSLDPSFNNAQVDIPEPEPTQYPQDLQAANQRSRVSSRDQHSLPLSYIDPDTGQEVPIPEEEHINSYNQTVQSPTGIQTIPAASIKTMGECNNDLILPSFRCETEQTNVYRHDNHADLDEKPPPTLSFYQRNMGDTVSSNITEDLTRKAAKLTDTNVRDNVESRSTYKKRKSGTVMMKLPSAWRVTKDLEGRVYYYNSKTKEVQWLPPNESTSVEEIESSSHDLVRNTNLSSHQIDILGATPESEEEDMDDDNKDESLMDEDGDESDIDEEDADLNLDMELDAKSIDNPQGPYSDLSVQERNLLLRFSKLSKEERQNERRQKRERDREKREYERKRRRERHGKHRKDGLVKEHLIPKRGEREKTDLMTFQEMRERLANRDAIRERQDIEERAEAERDREEERIKLRQIEKDRREQQALERQASITRQAAQVQPSVANETNLHLNSSSNSPNQQMPSDQEVQKAKESSVSSCEQYSKTTTAAADTSSEVAKKYKETFMKEVSKIIVKVLDPFRKGDATRGRIETIEDFKHLAKKLTEYILLKELKHCPRLEDLRFTESVKKKTAEFVRKYMLKFKDKYKRSPQKY